ncbi:uncharacterized protein AB675_6136 [Cyphellophora attinorum]|uniref:BTB domain-containing protein n=1 Tax=Cyphellophora attinorum TaxID=1664694 RepID=A0A0N1H902_9EURO|nr:uncharacterized protein AB675_6136 [Phialophora attinorum]KPI43806.1 hypothetical protein AB675_6136 [Phialophora attinorum]
MVCDDPEYRPEGLVQLKDAKRADFVIICGGFKFKVHKVIVSSWSKWFQRCIDGKFKEAEMSSVTLEEQEPYVVAMALMYMYTGYYMTDDISQVWPTLGVKRAEMDDDDGKGLDGFIKLLMLAEFLLMDKLVEDASEEILDQIDLVFDKSTNEDAPQDPWRDRWLHQLRWKLEAMSFNLDVLDKIYEDVSNAVELRALSWGDTTDPTETQIDSFKEDADLLHVKLQRLQVRLKSTIEAQDVVLYKVARHYSDEIEKLKSDHKAELQRRQVPSMPRDGWTSGF